MDVVEGFFEGGGFYGEEVLVVVFLCLGVEFVGFIDCVVDCFL